MDCDEENAEIAEYKGKYRPVYPACIYDAIRSYSKEFGTDENDLAIDAACGPGTSTHPLLKYYEYVIGYDVSSQVLLHAPRQHENIFFRIGPAENLGSLSEASVDLVTCAQAIHRLDTAVFYPEVQRVLKARGVLALYAYGDLTFDSHHVQHIFEQFYEEVGLAVDGYHNPDLLAIDGFYNDIDFPYEDFKRVDDLEMQHEWTIQHILGYIKSIPSYRAVLKANPTALHNLETRLKNTFGEQTSDEVTINMKWKVVLLLGHKPPVHFY